MLIGSLRTTERHRTSMVCWNTAPDVRMVFFGGYTGECSSERGRKEARIQRLEPLNRSPIQPYIVPREDDRLQ